MSSIKLFSAAPDTVNTPSFGAYSLFLNSLDGDKLYKKDYLGNVSKFDDSGELRALISLSQNGSNPPTITEHANTIGVLTSEYDSNGVYSIVSDSKFTLGKTRVIASPFASPSNFVITCVSDSDPVNKIFVQSQNGDDILNNFFVEIIVLNN
jgi:hypothetical protein